MHEVMESDLSMDQDNKCKSGFDTEYMYIYIANLRSILQ